MKVNFCGPIFAPSGYGEFSRYFIDSLNKSNFEISVEVIPIDVNKNTDYGNKGKVCKKLMSKKSEKPDFNIINMIPPMFNQYRKKDCVNIGFTMWEADNLPPLWTKLCNDMDAILVPCFWNKKVFEDSGVTVPVHVVQPGISTEEFPPIQGEMWPNEYKFYSIFQWTERKNPKALLTAYFSSFDESDNVSLTLKTSKPSLNNGLSILQEIEKIKSEIKLSPGRNFPKLKVVSELLSKGAMSDFHQAHNCFVSSHRSEAWGMSLMDAMAHGNLVIGTDYSGNKDFMNEKNSLLIDSKQAPVSNMAPYAPWFFANSMNWADIDVSELMDSMKSVVQNNGDYKKLSEQGRENIRLNFNNEKSSHQLSHALSSLIR